MNRLQRSRRAKTKCKGRRGRNVAQPVRGIELFCARIRQKFDAAIERDDPLECLTTEQVRRAVNAYLKAAAPRLTKTKHLEKELAHQKYHQRRNAQARRSHTKTRKARLKGLGIDADRINSCVPKPPD